MGGLSQVRLLLWKNYLLRRRSIISTLIEIAAPIFLFLIALAIRTQSEPETKAFLPPEPVQLLFPTTDLLKFIGYFAKVGGKIVYAPDVGDAGKAVGLIRQTINGWLAAAGSNITVDKSFHGYPTVAEALQVSSQDPNVYAGYIFDNFENSNGTFPDEVTYDLRFRTGVVPNSKKKYYMTNVIPNPDKPYVTSGYLYLQSLMDAAIVAVKTDKEDLTDPTRVIYSFPFPEYTDDGFGSAMKFWFPLFATLAWTYTCSVIVKSIVYEKEKRLKEAMKMMGLSNWANWTSWFISYFFFIMISVTLLVIIFKAGRLTIHTDWSVLFVLLALFATATILFCFFISTLFNRAKIAGAGGAILYFMGYVPYAVIVNNLDNIALGIKLGLSLVPPTGFGLGALILSEYEARAVDLTWSNIGQRSNPDNDLTLNSVFGMLFFSIFFYGILAWYIEAVFPGDYGIPQPWYFFLTKAYWIDGRVPDPMGEKRRQRLTKRLSEQSVESCEPDPTGLTEGISIKGLRKTYDGQKFALNGLTANMYEGQITGLLGHNGAGKTTTISILTGLYPPTDGEATILGRSIASDMQWIRKNMGLCPQFDVLWDQLSVKEHLEFYSGLKEVSKDIMESSITEMIKDLDLVEKTNDASSTLSGGMKRRLSVGIALVGGSRVVLLDEPTSGMDPSARRTCWDLILKYKAGRTIILTTHFMDEADVLSDRIIIMANGRLRTVGSSLFLKSKFGVGYYLRIAKEAKCTTHTVTDFIRKFVPDASLKTDVGTEISYLLPSKSVKQFEPLFASLTDNLGTLGITSYGVSITTLEEVFLQVAGKADEHEAAKESEENQISDDEDDVTKIKPREKDLLNEPLLGETSYSVNINRRAPTERVLKSGAKLKVTQFKAMIKKRWINTKRDRKAIISQLILPVFFVLIAMVITKIYPAEKDLEPISLNQSFYSSGSVALPYQDENGEMIPVLADYMNKNYPKIKQINVNDQPQKDLVKYLLDGHFQNDFDLYLAASNAPTGPKNVTAYATWYNNYGIHTPPIAVNLLSNLHYLNVTGGQTAKINTFNTPLPRSSDESFDQISKQGTSLSVAVNIIFGLSFLAASFTVFLVNERNSNAKHLQFVSGIDPVSYWFGSLVWDILNYFVPIVLIGVVIYGFQTDAYVGDNFPPIFLLLVMYGFAIIPIMYIVTFYFSTPATCFISMIGLNLLIGLGTTTSTFILETLNQDLKSISNVLKWIFYVLFPNFCLGRGFMDVSTNYYLTLIPGFKAPSPWDWEVTGKPLLFMAIQTVVFWIILFIIEYRFSGSLATSKEKSIASKAEQEHHQLDEDVQAEKERVKQNNSNDVVSIRNLMKVYKTGKFAVQGLSLGIPRAQCFGLLGVNGAGKTTTFKMLTGDIPPSAGDARLQGHSILNEMSRVRQLIGYCPQFDAIIPYMTGRELLVMYAELRGIQDNEIKEVVTEVIHRLELDKYADKQCGGYSGGNKRKLSTAIALVGDPPIVFLDEPTTGMDPKAKRFLWNTLTGVVAEGHTIILTSHSMEECEVLCNRLAIMVNGQFQCLGSPQHLKSRFGDGYCLMVKLRHNAAVDDLISFIQSFCPAAKVTENCNGMVKFAIPQTAARLSDLFGRLEEAKENMNMEEYSVSQTTLEEVFLNFAKKQEEGVDS